MSYVHPAWLEHQRKRFTRADAYRFAPPGSPEAKPPGWLDPSATRVRAKEAAEDEARARAAAEQEAFEREVEALRAANARVRIELADVKFALALRRIFHKYSPDQPRDDRGRWTDSGGNAQPAGPAGSSASDGVVLSDASRDPIRAGAQYAQDTTKHYSVDLDEEEAPRGIGHTQRDHVSKSDAELIDVLEKDWARVERLGLEVTRYRPAQGSFLSHESANDFVNRTLEDNKETVDLVAAGRKDIATLEKRFGYVTGKEAFRPNGDAEPYIRDTYGVRMVIRHDLRSDRGYRVYTAFPVNELVTRK